LVEFLVLGADTTVVVDDEILGKPDDRDHAVEMLRKLSGRTHEVLTGVALTCDEIVLTGVERTLVRFVAMDEDEVGWYADSGEPLGKAGGYAIQGLASRFVDRVEGSYTNVVGLPITLVYGLLRKAGRL
jgi:septum formation protein